MSIPRGTQVYRCQKFASYKKRKIEAVVIALPPDADGARTCLLTEAGLPPNGGDDPLLYNLPAEGFARWIGGADVVTPRGGYAHAAQLLAHRATAAVLYYVSGLLHPASYLELEEGQRAQGLHVGHNPDKHGAPPVSAVAALPVMLG